MKMGKLTDNYYSLIRPEQNVSYFHPGNIMIHGIHPEDVIDAPTFQQIYPKVKKLLDGSIVCAHNAHFDMQCLKKTCWNLHLDVPRVRYFDTVILSRRIYPMLQHHRLNDMCSYLNISLNHHNAASDAYGCLMIVVHAMMDTNEYDIETLLKRTKVKIHQLEG